MTAVVLLGERPAYYPAFLFGRVVDTIFGIIQMLLAIRFLFVLFGASPASPFVAWLYDVTGKLVGPFFGAFPVISVGGFLIEVATILAMIAYAIIAWLTIKLFAFVFSTNW